MAVQEGNSDVVEVRLAGGAGVLQVLLNQEVLSFTEQSWMDLKGEWAAGLPQGRSCALTSRLGLGARVQRWGPLHTIHVLSLALCCQSAPPCPLHGGHVPPAHLCVWADEVCGPR